jgi:hypothetical protein
MFASTLKARELLKLSFQSASADLPASTYTEKTTDRDANRRSVVFPVQPDLADEVIHQARDFFQELGFSKSVPKLYTTFSSGMHRTYIRVIAYKG